MAQVEGSGTAPPTAKSPNPWVTIVRSIFGPKFEPRSITLSSTNYLREKLDAVDSDAEFPAAVDQTKQQIAGIGKIERRACETGSRAQNCGPENRIARPQQGGGDIVRVAYQGCGIGLLGRAVEKA
jgi:hypothetical protein